MEYCDFDDGDYIILSVWDEGKTGKNFMGNVMFAKYQIEHGTAKWYPLQDIPKGSRPYHPSADERAAKDKSKEKEKDADKKGIAKVKSLITHKGDVVASQVGEGLQKGRTNLKDKIRGKKAITGEIRIEFETLY